MHLLDTNLVIHLRDGDEAAGARVASLTQPLVISILTRIELEGGIPRRASDLAARRARLDVILATLPTLPFDDACASRYRDIMEATDFSRPRIIDRMIAAQALLHDATVVTMNADDFKDVPGLKLLAW